jgi:N-acetylglucosaminyl-diphospho-decaprenol L-rhamnosyltransferase
LTASDEIPDGVDPARSRSRLTVVVVNWGTPDLTMRCVRGLLDDGVPAERVVVVDNGSTDDSHSRFEAELRSCRLLRLEQNIGYARAANAGARLLAGNAYLFVNNDAFVERRGSVAALVQSLADTTIGVVVARILNEDLTLQPSVYPIQTPAVALVLATGLSRLLPNRLQPRWGWHWDHSASSEIAGAAGTVVLVRGQLWKELGGWSEGAFLYSEDMDLCWRARRYGWKVWFTTEAEFVHLGRGSTSRHYGGEHRVELIARADAGMTRRNLSPAAARLALFFTGCGLALQWLGHAVAGHRDAAALSRAALRGHVGGIRERPATRA